MLETDFCRVLAEGEPMHGTAQSDITRWVALEDGSRWGAKPPKQSDLPSHVKAWLDQVGHEPGTRVQLIRSPGSPTGRGPRRKLVLARSPIDPAARRVVELEVELDDLPSIDPDALLDRAEPPRLAGSALAQLYLVCTHGARDRCCAKWGVSLWEAMRSRVDPERVWQCSHLGGHRFAPTMLALPSGLLWGRLEHDELDILVSEAAAGRIGLLDKLRGRSAYSAVAQAGECLLRQREGLREDGALRLREEIAGERGTRVLFDADAGVLEIVVERGGPGPASPSSCGDPAEPRSYWQVRV